MTICSLSKWSFGDLLSKCPFDSNKRGPYTYRFISTYIIKKKLTWIISSGKSIEAWYYTNRIWHIQRRLTINSHINMFIRCYGPVARCVNCGLRMRQNVGNVLFFRHHGLAILTCIMARAFEAGGRENDPGIPGACATRNFTYLIRGPCHT